MQEIVAPRIGACVLLKHPWLPTINTHTHTHTLTTQTRCHLSKDTNAPPPQRGCQFAGNRTQAPDLVQKDHFQHCQLNPFFLHKSQQKSSGKPSASSVSRVQGTGLPSSPPHATSACAVLAQPRGGAGHVDSQETFYQA